MTKLKKSKYFLLILCICLIVPAFVTSCGSDDSSTDISDVTKLYYYNKEHKDRYDAYQEANPDLTEEEVVWRVEADIDQPLYENMTLIDKEDENEDVLLVNKHFYLREDYEPEDLVVVDSGQQAISKAASAFEEMAKDAKEAGYNLYVRSGYRSIALQIKYYNNYKNTSGQEEADKYSARPQSSEHHTGRALDIVTDDWSFDTFDSTDACKWVQENAWKYGFVLRYPEDTTDITGYEYESWHFTYVGKEAAKIMHDEGIDTIEEYWVKYVKYNPDDK